MPWPRCFSFVGIVDLVNLIKGRSSVGALFRLYSLNTAAKTSLPKHRGANSIHGFFKKDKNLDRCKYDVHTPWRSISRTSKLKRLLRNLLSCRVSPRPRSYAWHSLRKNSAFKQFAVASPGLARCVFLRNESGQAYPLMRVEHSPAKKRIKFWAMALTGPLCNECQVKLNSARHLGAGSYFDARVRVPCFS